MTTTPATAALSAARPAKAGQQQPVGVLGFFRGL